MSDHLPVRKSTRLPNYDYAQPGAYFVTITARSDTTGFSVIRQQAAELTFAGSIISTVWQSLRTRLDGVETDEFIAMPDHVHGIVFLSGPADAMNRAPTLGEVVRVFKAVSTWQLHRAGLPDFTWQRNYYEHVVRNDVDLNRIREYIRNNPAAYELKGEEPPLPQ